MNNREAKQALVTFSIASLLNDIGAHIIKPLWPAFITIFLGAPASFLGFIDGLGEATSAISRYPAGMWTDIHKKKPFIWIGYLFGGLSRIGYAFSTFAAMLLPFHILDRTGKGIREPPRDAILAKYYHKHRGEAFGILEMFDHFGAAIGPLIGFALFAFLSYKYIFTIAAIPSFIGAFMIWKIIKEKKSNKYRVNKIKFRDYPANFKVLTLTSALFALSFFSVSFFILKGHEAGLPTKLLPIFYLFYILPAAISTYVFGKASDKIGRKKIMLLGFGLFSLSCLGFMFSAGWIIFIAFIFFGITYGIIQSVPKTFVSDIVAEPHRPSALGIYQMVFGIVALPASLIAGLLWDLFGSTITFSYGFGISTISLILFAIFVKSNKTFT